MDTIVTDETWKKVENNIPDFGKLNVQRVSYNLCPYIARDHQGYRHVLLPLDSIDEAIKDNKSRGILVFGRNLKIDDQPTQPFLDICCIQKENNHVFDMIINEILNKSKIGTTPVEAVTITLNNWRKFWLTGAKPILSENEIKGLFGELWFLQNWLLTNGEDQIMYWCGPSGNKYDFEANTCAIEVKTTSSIRGHVHKINGINQLELPRYGPLYLFSLRIRNDKESNHTLPSLIENIKGILASNESYLFDFENKLNQVGYLNEYSTEYDEYQFKIVDQRMYIVEEGFPRITVENFTSGVPVGVENIEYEINLNQCQKFFISASPIEWNVNNFRVRIN